MRVSPARGGNPPWDDSEGVRSTANQPAARKGIHHPFNQETNLAGTDCLQGFLKRHQVSLQTPAQTFSNLLNTLMEKHAYSSGDIYNVDETGMATVQGKPSRVIGRPGKNKWGAHAALVGG